MKRPVLGRGLDSLLPRLKFPSTDRNISPSIRRSTAESTDTTNIALVRDNSDAIIHPFPPAAAIVTSALSDEMDDARPATEDPSSATRGQLNRIPLSEIVPNENQPRKSFATEALQSLAASIQAQGLLQPILVRQLSANKYQIIAGERRWQAARLAGLAEIPVIVREVGTPESQLLLALVENLQRADLNPIEEARAFARMSSEFTMSHEDISSRIGRSRTAVTNAIRILSLPAEILSALEDGRVSSGQARPLLALSKPDALRLFARVLSEGLSARDVERYVGAYTETGMPSHKEKKNPSPAIADVEARLERKFGRKAKIAGTEKKGSVRFDYYSKDDLIQLVDQLLENE